MDIAFPVFKQLKIIGRGCQWRADLREESQYLVITVFIIRSRSLFFIIISESGKLREAIFQFLNKRVVSMKHEENIICRKTQLDSITHEQANIYI